MKAKSTPAVRASISFPPVLYEALEDIAKGKKYRWLGLCGTQRIDTLLAGRSLPVNKQEDHEDQ
jgi:hypothetical protein